MWFLAIGEIAVRLTSREPKCSARMMIKLMAKNRRLSCLDQSMARSSRLLIYAPSVTMANRPPRSFKTRSASNRMTSSITSFRKLDRPIVNDVPA